MSGSPLTTSSPIATPTTSTATEEPFESSMDEHDQYQPSTPFSTRICSDTTQWDTPWPGDIFQIVERSTRRAITLVDHEVLLRYASGSRTPSTLWYCIEKDGYFGFQNPRTGRYLGHDNRAGTCTQVHMKGWEMWTPRKHPDGGYQLLSPFWSGALMVLCLADDGITLTRRKHGTTLWDFNRVDHL
ncbi:hypothetical protein CDEST_13314 [Colletotrichum destructivum]|uniref:Bulb-type lectin domain-containing protein n=1 Tax=Colletotrichum destructivum TaxID=34406 RepID=A0AAX4IYH5_9PEZI|nr:hypothetical protein CDEST_13314 [Colletotrichum destructivum]